MELRNLAGVTISVFLFVIIAAEVLQTALPWSAGSAKEIMPAGLLQRFWQKSYALPSVSCGLFARSAISGNDGNTQSDRNSKQAGNLGVNEAEKVGGVGPEELQRCSSALLLGAWQNETFVPLPYGTLAPFLAEAQGKLSRAERMFAIGKRDGHDAAPLYLPFNDVGPDEPVPFSPPCYYHFYTKPEMLQLFDKKWALFLGDSNTRGLVLALLSILDPDHRSPYSNERWFNATFNWPHAYTIDYFFRADGSILFKAASDSRQLEGVPRPEGGSSFRLSFRMHFVSRGNAICHLIASISCLSPLLLGGQFSLQALPLFPIVAGSAPVDAGRLLEDAS
jgi:hypothetical protein